MLTNQSLQGLSTQEVEAKRAAGKVAVMPPPTTRTYVQIIREDVFTLVNNILFVLCLDVWTNKEYQNIWEVP